MAIVTETKNGYILLSSYHKLNFFDGHLGLTPYQGNDGFLAALILGFKYPGNPSVFLSNGGGVMALIGWAIVYLIGRIFLQSLAVQWWFRHVAIQQI